MEVSKNGSGLFAAIEAGGTKTVCALADVEGRFLAKTRIPTGDADQTFDAVRAFFRGAMDAGAALSGVGVAAFGPIDITPTSPNYGALLNTPKPGWRGANFVDALSDLGAPVRVDTDVNGAAIGEALAGAGRGLETLAYVTVGTGIGVGVLRDGRPCSGIGHYEMGHIRPHHDLAKDPYPGRCPFHSDCLEGLASGPAIAARWGAPLNELPDEVREAAIALEAEYLGSLALTVMLTHMPDRLIFGGGVMKAPGLIQAVRAATRDLLGGYVSDRRVDGDLSSYISPPALGDDAGLVGAAALARSAAAALAPQASR
ncbi:MAG: ROK family protein [Pseudomonadota bacterium]